MTRRAKSPTIDPTMSAPARPFEHVLAALWFLVTFTTFAYDEFILYPLALYFSYALYRDRAATLPILASCWPLLLLPVWAVLSSPLGVVPEIAFRSAIQSLLSMLICLLFATWMSPRRILLTALITTGICGVLSLFISADHGGAMTGIFAHKNMLGAKMQLLWGAALCVAFDKWFKPWLRFSAFALAGLAFYLILASQSATALVLSLVIVATIVGLAFFAGAADRIALGFLVIGLIALMVPSLVNQSDSLFGMLLERLGKNRTLTGRTELWAYAEDVIRQRPFIGHGGGGFWRYEENDLVRQIFAEFHKSPNQVFSFHNSFYEITVHYGIIGLGCILVTLAWAFVRLLTLALRYGSMPYIFFLTSAIVEIIRAYVESELMRPFVLAHALIWIGSCYMTKHRNVALNTNVKHRPTRNRRAGAIVY